jgi:hypothetical protein
MKIGYAISGCYHPAFKGKRKEIPTIIFSPFPEYFVEINPSGGCPLPHKAMHSEQEFNEGVMYA